MLPKKCKHKLCYEPADCRHGYCRDHCPTRHRHVKHGYHANKRKPTFNDKRRFLGLELEVMFENDKDMNRALASRVGCSDGSLPYLGAEFKLLMPTNTAAKRAADLVEDLWRRGARVHTRCGLHVHIDVRGVDQNRQTKFLQWCAYTQEVWFTLVPPSRRNNNFVKKLPNRPDYFTGGHYYWMHTTSLNTIECRIHGATVNPLKLEGWLGVMAHLQDKLYDAEYRFPVASGIQKATDEFGTPVASIISYTPTEAFWKVFEDARPVAKDYLLARQAKSGVLEDYAYQPKAAERRTEE